METPNMHIFFCVCYCHVRNPIFCCQGVSVTLSFLVRYDLQDGWDNYAEISNKNAPKIKVLIETIDDMDENKKKRF